MNKKISLMSIFLCIGLCACHETVTEQGTVPVQEFFSQEMLQERTDFLEPYHNFCEQENAEKIALIYLDEDTVPELLIRREREYELYFFDGSEVRAISMPDAEIRANTYGPMHGVEDYRRCQTLYWFEYVPRQGLVRVHGGDEEERHDYYLRYADGALSKELEAKSDGTWNTYEVDKERKTLLLEITSEEFRSRLTELGYDQLIPCAYLYDSVAAAYENMDAKTDSQKVLADFVNGRVDAICYEDSRGRGTPTEKGFFLRNYEEIYEDITCGETWWGSLKYVDFDNDGEDELLLGGYTGARMFFDVIGDTVYEVLHTCGTADNGYVAEMNGRKVIERTDLLHGGRQIYHVQEYDSCCCVIDNFILRTDFEGERYAEGDEFEYRNREITMEEFEEIAHSIHTIQLENRVLDYWLGEYEFSESVGEPVFMVMDYRIEIYKEDGEYYADIEIDGQTTLARIRAKAGLESGSDRIELVFCEYLPEHVIGGVDAEEGEVLLVLERKNGEILTVWGEITPMLHENEENGKIYFRKNEGAGDIDKFANLMAGDFSEVEGLDAKQIDSLEFVYRRFQEMDKLLWIQWDITGDGKNELLMVESFPDGHKSIVSGIFMLRDGKCRRILWDDNDYTECFYLVEGNIVRYGANYGLGTQHFYDTYEFDSEGVSRRLKQFEIIEIHENEDISLNFIKRGFTVPGTYYVVTTYGEDGYSPETETEMDREEWMSEFGREIGDYETVNNSL